MAQIFLNYRKEGGAYAAALLDEFLSSRFGRDAVFRAARSIIPGSDYARSILEAISGCEVLLVVVDSGWGDRFKSDYFDPVAQENWVVREIGEAFKSEKVVIPVLLSGAVRLNEEHLPGVLARVARLQYLRFDYRNTWQDFNFMAEHLEGLCSRLRTLRDG